MPAVMLAAALVAVVLLLALGPLRRQPVAERIVLAAGGGVLALAGLSWLAMRAGVYAPLLIAPALVLVGGAAFWLARHDWAPEAVPFATPDAERGGRVALVLLACFAALYGLFPTYFLLGGQDPGVYLEFAAHVAKSGGLNLDLPWLRAFHEAHPLSVALGYPGVYSLLQSGVGNDASRLSPQFVHLFPALAANAWAAGGLEATLRVNAALATLSLGVGFVLVRRLAGWVAGLGFILALGLNPAFIWGARVTLTETFAAGLNLAGFFLLLLAAESRRVGWSIAAGAVFGLGILNRLDAGFDGLAVLGFGLAAMAERGRARSAAAMALAYLGVSTLAFLDARLSSPFYFRALAARHHLVPLIALSTLSALLALVASAPTPRFSWRVEAGGRALPRLAAAVMLALALWVLFALLVWPNRDPSANARAAQELGWYLTPVAWPLMLVGLVLTLRRRASPISLPLLLFVAGTLVAFTAGPNVVPEHIWASRRWLSHVIPLGLLVAVLGVHELAQLFAKWPAARVTAVAVLGSAYVVPAVTFARPFLFQTMLPGLPDAYTALLREIDASGLPRPLVTTHPHVASILTYVYDTPTVVTGSSASYGTSDENVRAALAAGELGGLGAIGVDPFEVNANVFASARYSGDYLEGVQGARPKELAAYVVPLSLGRIGGRLFDFEVRATHPRFTSEVGVRTLGDAVRATGRAGILLRGPHTELVPGQYELDFIGRVGSVGSGERPATLEVTCDHGRQLLASKALRVRASSEEKWLGGLDVSLDRNASDVEFRVRIERGVDLELTRVRLRRTALGSL